MTLRNPSSRVFVLETCGAARSRGHARTVGKEARGGKVRASESESETDAERVGARCRGEEGGRRAQPAQMGRAVSECPRRSAPAAGHCARAPPRRGAAFEGSTMRRRRTLRAKNWNCFCPERHIFAPSSARISPDCGTDACVCGSHTRTVHCTALAQRVSRRCLQTRDAPPPRLQIYQILSHSLSLRLFLPANGTVPVQYHGLGELGSTGSQRAGDAKSGLRWP